MSNSGCRVSGDTEEAPVRTIECLRARLLAERQASRAAGEQARLLSSTLVELEKRLTEETLLRDRTQKRLHLLSKKLQSVKFQESEQSRVSGSSLVSLSTESSATSVIPSSLSLAEPPADAEGERSESHFKINQEKSFPDPKTSMSRPSDRNSSYGVISHSDSANSKIAEDREGRGDEDEDEDEGVDNTLAIVPVSAAVPEKKERTAEVMDYSVQVREVLETLRLAKASIQASLRQRQTDTHMMKVARLGRRPSPPPHAFYAPQHQLC